MSHKVSSPFFFGMKCMLPVIAGVVPFGMIMGTAAQNAAISVFEMEIINFVVFAGAAQLVSVDLMTQNVDAAVIIFTGLVINLRMMLYSAAFAPLFTKSSFLEKTIASYLLTDQAYAVYVGNEGVYKSRRDKISFYFGAALFMCFSWHASVLLGFAFGNITPPSISLDFAVPLSFMALMIPSLKNNTYVYVALISGLCSILFFNLPYNLGLIISSGIGISFGAYCTLKKTQVVV